MMKNLSSYLHKFQIMFIIKFQTLQEFQVESKFCPNGTLYNIIEIKGFCFQNQAPPWWKQPLMGPAFPTGHKPAPKEMRKPGCNGGVCYCNKENYCNDRHNVSRNSQQKSRHATPEIVLRQSSDYEPVHHHNNLLISQ